MPEDNYLNIPDTPSDGSAVAASPAVFGVPLPQPPTAADDGSITMGTSRGLFRSIPRPSNHLWGTR